jgi:DNA-binding XRE family transcriptional regulator
VAAVEEGQKARRLKRPGGPDEVEELLAQVSDWCSEQHGRQTQIAKAIGTKPQTINDWLNGRKRPTAKYALRLARFLYHQVRPAFNAFIRPFGIKVRQMPNRVARQREAR